MSNRDQEFRQIVSAAIDEYRAALDEVDGRADVREEADRLVERITDGMRGSNYLRVRVAARKTTDGFVEVADGSRGDPFRRVAVRMVAYPEFGSWYGLLDGELMYAPMHTSGSFLDSEIGEVDWLNIDPSVAATDRVVRRDLRFL